jgi:hypothetical protein
MCPALGYLGSSTPPIERGPPDVEQDGGGQQPPQLLVVDAHVGACAACGAHGSTAASLPTSVVVALLGTSIAGFWLNVLTLAGLTIAGRNA